MTLASGVDQLTGVPWIDFLIIASVALGAFAVVVRSIIRAGHVIGVIDELKDDLLGTDGKPSLTAQTAANTALLADMSRRPALNGGFDRLLAKVDDLQQGHVVTRRAAQDAEDRAAEAAEKAWAAVFEAQIAAQRVQEMHRDNTTRLDALERKVDGIAVDVTDAATGHSPTG